MGHRRIARQQLRGLDPALLGNVEVQLDFLIGNRAAIGHCKRLGHLQHHVGLRNPPTLDKLRRLGQVRQIARRATFVDPVVDQLLFRFRQPGVVRKMTVLRIGVPGRHPPDGNHLLDRFGPADRLVVRRQRERPHLATAMAEHAVLIEHAGDVLGIRHLASRGRPLGSADIAAGRLGDGPGHFFSGQQLIERVGNVVARGGRTGIADAVLIVDHASITHSPIAVEDERIGRPLGAELIGHRVSGILQDRKRDLVLAGIVGDVGQRILRVGIDADESHSLVAIAVSQFGQPWTGQPRHRALGAQKDHDDRFLVGPLVELVDGPQIIVQFETRDLPPQGGLGRFFGFDVAGHQWSQKEQAQGNGLHDCFSARSRREGRIGIGFQDFMSIGIPMQTRPIGGSGDSPRVLNIRGHAC